MLSSHLRLLLRLRLLCPLLLLLCPQRLCLLCLSLGGKLCGLLLLLSLRSKALQISLLLTVRLHLCGGVHLCYLGG